MYTYLIGWSKHNKYYYGVRYAKGCTPNELWVTYFTSSKYVKAFEKEYGKPDVIEIRKTFTDKRKAMLWEHKVLKRINATFSDKWLNKTDNIAIDYYSMSHNTVPATMAAREKTKGKTYEEIFNDVSKIADKKKNSSEVSRKNWSDPELRQRMIKKPEDTSRYKEAALKRWANKETREKLCASMRGARKTTGAL